MKKQTNNRLSEAEFKTCMLEVLEVVANYCDEQNLTYFLAYGTLLGAVRHKGFIPWDDDVDIMMPREDYNKLVKHFNRTNDRYQLVDLSVNKQYYLPFAKVYDTHTRVKEPVKPTMELGVYLDVFPIDELGNDKEAARKFQSSLGFKRNLLMAKLNPWHKNRSLKNNITCFLASCFPVSVQTLCQKLENAWQSFSEIKGKYIGVLMYDKIFKSEWVASATQLNFEGKVFKVPVGYHELLTVEYGDYMQLPPVEQREGQHALVAYWKNK